MRRKGHPLFAALYDVMAAAGERKHFSRHRETLLRAVGGRVLEIGVGTGVNFAHYADDLTVIATEPDPYMLRRAAIKAATGRTRIRFVQAKAESLPFPDRAFDAVVSTLVLCSVTSPLRVLHELGRVLRPEGRLLFLEHVRAETAGWQRFQDAVTPVWRLVGAGCHPNRDTARMLQQAGFVITTLEQLKFGPYPIRPQIKGIARTAP
jgi:ubiquinone/menaquinone biosynthesis C-methylase UbiE